jgi:hypothetical protein
MQASLQVGSREEFFLDTKNDPDDETLTQKRAVEV